MTISSLPTLTFLGGMWVEHIEARRKKKQQAGRSHNQQKREMSLSWPGSPTCYRKQRAGLDRQDGDMVSFAQVSGEFQPAGSDC